MILLKRQDLAACDQVSLRLSNHRRSNDMDQQEADDKHHRAGDAMNGERSRLRPARPRMIDMSPKGMMASTSRAMPTSRLSAVSIMVSTTNPDAMSRIPLGRSQARVSASDAGGLRPNVPEIRSGDTR